MIRFLYVIIMNLFRAPYIISKMRRQSEQPDKYTLEQRYFLAKRVVHIMKITGNIKTVFSGSENLPAEGGYIMFPNHQGKYDALGIIDTHASPCSLVMDKAKSNTILVKEFIDLLQGKRLEKDNIRQSLQIIREVAEEVGRGRKFLIFPEGGYDYKTQNMLSEFKAGTFKAAYLARAPIVPVAIIDSYKVFRGLSIKQVTTQVHYLKALTFEEYGHLKTAETASLVQSIVQDAIKQHQQEYAGAAMEVSY